MKSPAEMRALAAQLATATEALNEALANAEAAIAGLNLGVTAEVPLPGGGALVWRKDGDRWALLFETDSTFEPLRHASRAVRLKAVGQLPKLVDAMRAQVVLQLDEVLKAINAAEAFTAEAAAQANKKTA